MQSHPLPPAVVFLLHIQLLLLDLLLPAPWMELPMLGCKHSCKAALLLKNSIHDQRQSFAFSAFALFRSLVATEYSSVA